VHLTNSQTVFKVAVESWTFVHYTKRVFTLQNSICCNNGGGAWFPWIYLRSLWK